MNMDVLPPSRKKWSYGMDEQYLVAWLNRFSCVRAIVESGAGIRHYYTYLTDNLTFY